MLSIELSAAGDDGWAVAALHGELDVSEAAGVASALAVMVGRRPNIVVDLTRLEFIDCHGLRALAAPLVTQTPGPRPAPSPAAARQSIRLCPSRGLLTAMLAPIESIPARSAIAHRPPPRACL